MKTLLIACALILPALSHASDLKDCQQKISDMVNQIAKAQVQGPNGSAEYHLNRAKSCGVEYAADQNYFTVTKFDGENLKKFETILFNENDITAGGRVKGSVTCEIQGNSVFYTTKLPIFSDGVRSPFQVKTLAVTQADGQILVSLKSKLSLLSSTVACTLD